MPSEVARVPAQIFFDGGLHPGARVCLALMYLDATNAGFCKLSAQKLGLQMGSTPTSIRRHWNDLRTAGYIVYDVTPGLRRKRHEVRGHYLALAPDGHAHHGFTAKGVGTDLVYVGSE